MRNPSYAELLVSQQRANRLSGVLGGFGHDVRSLAAWDGIEIPRGVHGRRHQARIKVIETGAGALWDWANEATPTPASTRPTSSWTTTVEHDGRIVMTRWVLVFMIVDPCNVVRSRADPRRRKLRCRREKADPFHRFS